MRDVMQTFHNVKKKNQNKLGTLREGQEMVQNEWINDVNTRAE